MSDSAAEWEAVGGGEAAGSQPLAEAPARGRPRPSSSPSPSPSPPLPVFSRRLRVETPRVSSEHSNARPLPVARIAPWRRSVLTLARVAPGPWRHRQVRRRRVRERVVVRVWVWMRMRVRVRLRGPVVQQRVHVHVRMRVRVRRRLQATAVRRWLRRRQARGAPGQTALEFEGLQL